LVAKYVYIGTNEPGSRLSAVLDPIKNKILYRSHIPIGIEEYSTFPVMEKGISENTEIDKYITKSH